MTAKGMRLINSRRKCMLSSCSMVPSMDSKNQLSVTKKICTLGTIAKSTTEYKSKSDICFRRTISCCFFFSLSIISRFFQSGTFRHRSCSSFLAFSSNCTVNRSVPLHKQVRNLICYCLNLHTKCNVSTCTCRRTKKIIIPQEKNRYISGNIVIFFHQIHSIYKEGFRPHILYISLQYFVAFSNYNYLNLNVHFSK